MGDPRKQRRKFSYPGHPWNKERIETEKALMKEYGLGNKTEIYRSNSLLSRFKQQAKKLVPLSHPQAETEKKDLIRKLQGLKLLGDNAALADVLTITLKDILERRLQTIAFRRNLARTMKQARQFIVHEHILVKGKKITAPGFMVNSEEEGSITFSQGSALSKEDHPERSPPKTEETSTDKSAEAGKEDKKPARKGKERHGRKPANDRPRKEHQKKEVKEEKKEGEQA